MWKQLRAFNQSAAGKVKGECLRNVRLGFGIASKYPTAWQAWENTDKHTGSAPSGVDVPVFFSYGTDGHVGVRLANGKFWSDGVVYTSIAAYNAAGHTPKYVGWSTSVDGGQVIQYAADPAPTSQRLYFDPIGQTATFYRVSGGTYAMKIKDASYNWRVLENQGNRVRVNSASAGGDCWVYLKYSNTGNTIPGRYVK